MGFFIFELKIGSFYALSYYGIYAEDVDIYKVGFQPVKTHGD